jgi:hypothetical protein
MSVLLFLCALNMLVHGHQEGLDLLVLFLIELADDLALAFAVSSMAQIPDMLLRLYPACEQKGVCEL